MDLQFFEACMKERSETSRAQRQLGFYFWVITCFSLWHLHLLLPFFYDETTHLTSEASPQASNRLP